MYVTTKVPQMHSTLASFSNCPWLVTYSVFPDSAALTSWSNNNDNNLNIHDLDIVWNNAFRHIFNCCWRKYGRQLQFFCKSMTLSLYYRWTALILYEETSISW